MVYCNCAVVLYVLCGYIEGSTYYPIKHRTIFTVSIRNNIIHNKQMIRFDHISFQQNLIQTNSLFHLTLALLCVDAFLIAVIAYGGGGSIKSSVVTQLLQNGAYGQLTLCEFPNDGIFLIVEIIFKGMLLMAACYLCWKVRHIADALAGRWGLILTVYTTTIVCGIILLVLTSVSDVPTQVVITSIGICFCAIITTLSLTVPNAYQLLTIGDEEAVHDVMTDVFSEEAARRRNRGTSMFTFTRSFSDTMKSITVSIWSYS
jgi:hypothetical protein